MASGRLHYAPPVGVPPHEQPLRCIMIPDTTVVRAIVAAAAAAVPPPLWILWMACSALGGVGQRDGLHFEVAAALLQAKQYLLTFNPLPSQQQHLRNARSEAATHCNVHGRVTPSCFRANHQRAWSGYNTVMVCVCNGERV